MTEGRGRRRGQRPRKLALALSLGAPLSGCAEPPTGSTPEALDAPAVVMTTTDFATGAVTVLDLASGVVHADVALASPDAIPFVNAGLIYILNRYMYDYITVLDPAQGFSIVAEHGLSLAGESSVNPHGLAFDAQGLAWISMYGTNEVQVHDLMAATGASRVDVVDTSALADADGLAEVEALVAREGRMWLLSHPVDRLAGWSSAGPEQLVEVDVVTRTLLDRDPSLDGVQGIELPCTWARQVRPHPLDDSRILVLCEGVVDVDLAAESWSWWIAPDRFPHADAGDHLLPQALAVDASGRTALASYDPEYEQVGIWELDAELDPRLILDGVQSVERALELHEGTLWIGDRDVNGSGLLGVTWDGVITQSLRDTGLPPYATVLWSEGT